jgi:hypothetical protein
VKFSEAFGVSRYAELSSCQKKNGAEWVNIIFSIDYVTQAFNSTRIVRARCQDDQFLYSRYRRFEIYNASANTAAPIAPAPIIAVCIAPAAAVVVLLPDAVASPLLLPSPPPPPVAFAAIAVGTI